MKHIFTVEVTEEDSLDRLKTYIQAESYKCAVEEWFNDVRAIIKYGGDEETETEKLIPGLEKAREMLRASLSEVE
jgi:hypothetical protein